ncbi:MAG: MobF family relaxase [Planctomycetota bacterium]
MVASIVKMAGGLYKYYTQLAQEDYYTKGGEPPGQWLGKGAARLGLTETVDDRSLAAVLDGFAPGGKKKLVKNAGEENRQPGWDLTFSAPKSVSVAWGIADHDLRKQIEQAHQEAVKTAIEYLEENSLFARSGRGGSDLKKADAVVATFLHGTSRELDPNLHTHCLIANVGLYGDDESRTLKSTILYDRKMVSGALYRTALANGLAQIGFQLEAVNDWFEITGISQEARDFFSKRRQAILEAAGDGASAKELDRATLKTRSVKGHVARDELYHQWQENGKQFGLSAESIRESLVDHSGHRRPDRETAEKVLKESLKDLAEVDSVHEKHQVLKAMFGKLQTGQAEVRTVIDVLDSAIKTGKRLTSLGTSSATQKEYLSSEEIRKSENRVRDAAKKLVQDSSVLGSRYTTESVLSGGIVGATKRTANAFVDGRLPEYLRLKFEAPVYDRLNKQQRDAVMDLTTRKSKLRTVRGVAGAGKTTMLAAAREAWEANGYKVIGCSLSGVAAQELAKGAGINSETIRMTLMRLEKDRIRKLKHDVRMVVRAFFKQKTYQYDQMKLDKKSVLVVDEASMVGTNDMATLLEHAAKAGARVVLVGDTRQLPSIERGGAFEKIHQMVKGVELTESVRQKSDWLKEAVKLVNEGDIRGTLAKFVEAGRLSLSNLGDDCHRKLIDDWVQNRTEDLSETVILASRNEDVDKLNLAAQDARRRNGELGAGKFTWNEVTYRVGERSMFHFNDRKQGIWNGSKGTIKHIVCPFNPYSVRFGVELDSGEFVNLAPGRLKNADDISLGYASTVHKAQGITVDKTFLMVDRQLANQQSTYVGLTRSREDTFVYAESDSVGEDVQELNRVMSRDSSKRFSIDTERQLSESGCRSRTSIDAPPPPPPPPPPKRGHELVQEYTR